MARFESEIPCLILDDDELKSRAVVGEWREDRHNLEAARIFGSSGPNQGTFPTAFQSYRPERKVSKHVFRSSKSVNGVSGSGSGSGSGITGPPAPAPAPAPPPTGSLIEAVRTVFPADPAYAPITPPASPKTTPKD
jgi:hypothetical protein